MTQHPLARQGRQTIQVITDQATQSPGGYLWWHSLPAKGNHSQAVLKRKWTAVLLTRLFPPLLLTAMLQACLTVEGLPCHRSKLLYTWMLKNVYKSNYRQMYKDWLSLDKQS